MYRLFIYNYTLHVNLPYSHWLLRVGSMFNAVCFQTVLCCQELWLAWKPAECGWITFPWFEQ